MDYRRAYPGKGGGISSSQWNGFLDMHRQWSGTKAHTLPTIYSNTTVASARLSSSSVPNIPAFTPVVIERVVNLTDLNGSSPSYIVSEASPATDTITGSYGITLFGGVSYNGGQIAIAGVGVVRVPIAQLLESRGGSELPDGGWDSAYYCIPDQTIKDDTTNVLGPVGHFRVISWFQPNKVSESLEDAYLAVDMNSSPTTIIVDLQDDIPASVVDGTDTELFTLSGVEGYVYRGYTGSDLANAEIEVKVSDGTDTDYAVNVYNATEEDVPQGRVTATYSKEYNCFLANPVGGTTETKVPGGGTTSTGDSTYVCCECTNSALTICGPEGFSFEKTKVSLVSGGSIQHYVDIICDDDGSRLTLTLETLDCSSTICKFLDLSSTSLGTCGDIGIVYYGNDTSCCGTPCPVDANGNDMGVSTETFDGGDPTGTHDGWTVTDDDSWATFAAGDVSVSTAPASGSIFDIEGSCNPATEEARTLTATFNITMEDWAIYEVTTDALYLRWGAGFAGSNDLNDEYFNYEWEYDVDVDYFKVKNGSDIATKPNDGLSHEYKIVIVYGATTADTTFYKDGVSIGTRTGWTHGKSFETPCGLNEAHCWVASGWTEPTDDSDKFTIHDMQITFI